MPNDSLAVGHGRQTAPGPNSARHPARQPV
jgi:hypothetical protein